MFIKIVIVLLLLIVAASLLTGRRNQPVAPGQQSPAGRIRPLMIRVALVLLAIGAGLTVLHLAGCAQETSFHATTVNEPGFGRLSRLESLQDPTGRRLTSADFSGKAVVVFFGYTRCPDICPTALATMQEVMHQLGPDAARVQVLFVTVDPERDTPELLQRYVPWFHPSFVGLSGDPATTLAVAREFRVFYSKVQGESALGYGIDHTATSYVYDTTGRLRLLVKQGETAGHLTADLRQLLAGR